MLLDAERIVKGTQELAHRSPAARVQQLRCQLAERLQDKAPSGQTGVGQGETRAAQDLPVEEQQVEVQDPRGMVGLPRRATRETLEALQGREQWDRLEGSV